MRYIVIAGDPDTGACTIYAEAENGAHGRYEGYLQRARGVWRLFAKEAFAAKLFGAVIEVPDGQIER